MKHPFYALIIPMQVPVEPEPPQPPLGFWGPNDPRPSQPIQLPPWAGQPQPGWPPQPPLGMWGPNDPRPTPPIPVYPGGSPVPPGWQPPQPPLGMWGPNDGRPTNPIPIYPGGSPNPPGTGDGGGGNLPTTPPPTEPPSTPTLEEGEKWVVFWDREQGEWVWAIVPSTNPGYNPPGGSGAPPNVATPVKGK